MREYVYFGDGRIPVDFKARYPVTNDDRNKIKIIEELFSLKLIKQRTLIDLIAILMSFQRSMT